jgi:hypothetical protein
MNYGGITVTRITVRITVTVHSIDTSHRAARHAGIFPLDAAIGVAAHQNRVLASVVPVYTGLALA